MTQKTHHATLNDQIRASGAFGPETENPLVITPGVNALGSDLIGGLFLECMQFRDFDPEFDPSGLHDFGLLTSAGVDVWFRIDVHPEASNRRVFTFLLPDEN